MSSRRAGSNLIGDGEKIFGAEKARAAGRAPRSDLSLDPDLPDDTRLWAALQQACGGTWGGSDCLGAQASLATVAATFWLPLKKLSGSYFALMATSRSKFTP